MISELYLVDFSQLVVLLLDGLLALLLLGLVHHGADGLLDHRQDLQRQAGEARQVFSIIQHRRLLSANCQN